ncbi:hypothetical protein OPV22_021727 [Ensete ventricosum]|uniref:Cellulose synthase n=1 Tax=Ensete ventricosum TaxID=4639 RepID=A0AAV8QQW6_ENSVE|nr:hypothetical protein OPV22_021727 [Ensete ventricosum]
MEASAGLVAGSHNRNELVVIRRDGDMGPKPLQQLGGQICQICGDDVGLTVDGDLFVACNECASPIFRTCYEYERREGNLVCPQCKTRFKGLKGCPRVAGDEEEDGIDDLENEFNFVRGDKQDSQYIVEAMLQAHMSYGHQGDIIMPYVVHTAPQVPLLTNGEIVDYIPPEQHALVPSFMGGGGKRIHPLPFSDPNLSVHLRSLYAYTQTYGYGSVAWKERMENWRQKQEKMHKTRNDGGGKGWSNDNKEPDLPLMDEARQPLETYLDRLSLRYEKEGQPSQLSPIDIFHYQKHLNLQEMGSFLAMKREYEEFKVRINALVAKAQKVPEEGWTMQDGTPWPGNNVRDHPGMIQVNRLLGQSGGHDVEGNELSRLVYVSREKRPGFNHHKKAGAMNALVRVSAVLTNAPYLLNVDCDHYFNNSKAIREAMCFMMDPLVGKKVCYVQFPQRFDGIDGHDRYATRNIVFFDINMEGLDGIQGPIYVGTGCAFRRQALYGYDAPKSKKPPTRTCNCWPKWCCCGCCCSGRRKKKTAKAKQEKRRNSSRRGDNGAPVLALEGIEDGKQGNENDKQKLMSEQKLEKKFGQSPVFVASTLLKNGGTLKGATPASLLKEAIHVISCGHEEKTDWGKEIGWIYGSVTEDILTGFKMHCHGWRSIYCIPGRPAFKGSAPLNLLDRLHQILRWALGSAENFLSKHCPLWYGYRGGLTWLELLSYINATVYPWTSIPLLAYCTLPAVCLLTGKFITPELSNVAILWFLSLFICIFVTSILEMRWSGVGIDDWWRNEQFWVIGGVSSHLFAVFQGLLKVLAGIDTNFTVTTKAGDDEEFSELYTFKWTTLLIPPTTLLIVNFIDMVAGVSNAINNGSCGSAEPNAYNCHHCN